MQKPESLTDLLSELAILSDLSEVESLLSWDQDTYMPGGGAAGRAHQFATLAALKHERLTSPRVGELLAELGEGELGEGGSDEAIVQLARRQYQRATKLPPELVAELARRSSSARAAWVRAREEDDFAQFEPELAALVELKRQEADAVGYAGERYDALLDEFEPGVTTSDARELFKPLRAEQVEFVAELLERGTPPPGARAPSPLRQEFEVSAQAAYVEALAAAVGYDFSRGRLDATIHPFATSMGVGDVRITTRYDERDLAPALFGALHEVGHALYEQGVDPAHARTPLASGVSLGVHESQSRLWENLVGRSLPFWEGEFPNLKAAFPAELRGVNAAAFYEAVNRVERDLIRIEADEVTYNLHVLVRFELELALIEGSLSVSDLPGAWNEKYEQYLGVTPASLREGCLQDIHWSVGLFGYFPTYTLGNLMSVQFFNAAEAAIGNVAATLRARDYAPLHEWLRENVYRHGSRYEPAELLRRATGSAPSARPYLDYLREKYGALYGLD